MAKSFSRYFFWGSQQKYMGQLMFGLVGSSPRPIARWLLGCGLLATIHAALQQTIAEQQNTLFIDHPPLLHPTF